MHDVLVIAHHYVPAHPRVRHQLEGIAAAGLRADVICLRGEGEPFRGLYGSAQLYRLPVRRHRGAGLVVYAAELLGFFGMAGVVASWLHLRRRHATVIIHNLPDPLVFAAAIPRLLGARLLLNMHEFTPELFRTRHGLGENHPMIRISRLLERASARLVDTVITVHEPGAELLASRGIPREKIEVVNNASEMRPVRAGARPARNGGGTFTLLYHGTYGNEYDLSTVVEAMGVLRDLGDPASDGLRLRVVGDGAQRATLGAQVATLNLDAQVSLEPPVPYHQIPTIVEQADAGVVLLRETPYAALGLPTKLLECVAMGLPVITTPGMVARHYLPDDSVHFVPFGDVQATANAIRELRRSPEEARVKAERATHVLQPFQRDAVCRRYAEVVGAGRAPATEYRPNLLARMRDAER